MPIFFLFLGIRIIYQKSLKWDYKINKAFDSSGVFLVFNPAVQHLTAHTGRVNGPIP